MSTIIVRTPAGLNKAKGTFQAGDTIVFSKRRWSRMQLDAGWSDVRFAAKPGATFAGFELMPNVRGLILDSLEVTDCPDVGVQLRRDGELAPSVTILNPNFHHSEFNLIAGAAGGDGVIVRGGYLGDVNRDGCDAKNCPELFRIHGGGPWEFDGVECGPAAPHGPQGRIFPQSEYPLIHDVWVHDCDFHSTTKDQTGIDIEGSSRQPPRFPHPIRISSNGFDVSENGVGLGSSWENCPHELRPVVEGNRMRFQGGDQCARGRFISNVAKATRGDECAGVTIERHA